MTALDFTDHSAPYITGNGFACRCARFFAWGALQRNPTRDNDVVYCKTDDVPTFFVSPDCPREPFVLVTHNSDLPVGESYRRYLDDSRVRLWLAQNPTIDHPKLRAIPIGIANAQWPHGDVAKFDAARALLPAPRTQLFYACYSLDTDTDGERARCRAGTGIEPSPPVPFEEYLANLSRSVYVISPSGRGIDTHRTWEALYMGAVPIMRSSRISRDHGDFPLWAIIDWEIEPCSFKEHWAGDLWRSFDPALLTMDGYCERLRKKYGVNL